MSISIVAFVGYLILAAYLGVIIGEVKASIVAMKENAKDKADLDKMTELLAKMTLTIEQLLGKSNDVDKTNQ